MKSGKYSRLMLACVVVLAVLLGFATTAFAAISVGAPIPAEGAIVSSPVDISVKFADTAAELRTAQCSIVVGGATIPATVNDGGTLKVTGAALAPGTYTAVATAVDAKLKTYTKVWSFSVGSATATDPTELVGAFPTGLIATNSPEVGCFYTGEKPINFVIWVDGGMVINSYSLPTAPDTKLSVVVPGLAPGVHTAEVGANYSGGAVYSGVFSFTVPGGAADPLNCLAAGCHEGVMAIHKFPSCAPCHGEGSPFGGGYASVGLSPHGQKAPGCVGVGCHAGVTDPANNADLITTCAAVGCHDGDPAQKHHSLAKLEDSCNDGCHAVNSVGPIGVAGGASACVKCHFEVPAVFHHDLANKADACNGSCHGREEIGPYGVVGGANACVKCHYQGVPIIHHKYANIADGCNAVCHANAGPGPGAFGVAGGQACAAKCHVASDTAQKNMDFHHDLEDAVTTCAKCHAPVVAQASPVLTTAPGSTTPLVKKATMTHLKAGTGDPWLVNGNPATRKSECTDCHNIAAATLGDPLAGVKGYKPIFDGKAVWANFGAADFSEVTVGNAGEDSIYLCVKCHAGPASAAGTTVNRFAEGRFETNGNTVTASSGSTIPTTNFASTYQRGDIAKEFNPNNVSGHRVFADDDGVFRGEVKTEWTNVRTVPSNAVGLYGTNTGVVIEPKLQLPIRSLKSWFKPGWAYNTQMTCTDCHTNLASTAATGPHGANTSYGLDPAYPRDWKFAIPSGQNTTSTTNNNIICAKCHDLNDTNSSAAKTIDGVTVPASPANGHRRSEHASYACVSCHTAIPHGSNRPRLLNDWNRDEQAYTKRQYGTAVSGASINILGAAPTRTNLTAAQLTSTTYAWGSGSGATGNCTRGCGTHGSVSATQYVWE